MTKTRLRIIADTEEDDPVQAAPEESFEAPESDLDADYDEHFTEEGDPVSRDMTTADLLALCDQLTHGVQSVVHFGVMFKYGRDRNKRCLNILKKIDEIRIAIQFDEFMVEKRERPT